MKKFPQVDVTDYDSRLRPLIGAIDPRQRNWYSWSANGTVSKLLGSHTLKAGVDYRLIGIDTQSFADGAGDVPLRSPLHLARPRTRNGATRRATPSRASCSAIPRATRATRAASACRRRSSCSRQLLRRLRPGRLPRQPEADAQLRPAPRARRRAERERTTASPWRFDRTLNPGGALGNVVNPSTGSRFAAALSTPASTAPTTTRATRRAMKFSPRVGVVYSFNPKTVVRAGYGLYWAPWNYQGVGSDQLRPVGFSQYTFIKQGSVHPDDDADAIRSRAACCSRSATRSARSTGVGGKIEFIDQDKKAPYIHHVLGRHRPRAAGQHGGRLRIRRRHRPRSRPRRLERRHHQHQPGADSSTSRSARR